MRRITDHQSPRGTWCRWSGTAVSAPYSLETCPNECPGSAIEDGAEQTVAIKTSRSGVMIMLPEALLEMLTLMWESEHVVTKADCISFIGGYMTGDPEFREKLHMLLYSSKED